MAEFSNNVKKKSLLRSVHSVLSKELKTGISTIEQRLLKLKTLKKSDRGRYLRLLKNEGFNEQECATLLKHLNANLRNSKIYELKDPKAIACYGDVVLKNNIRGFKGKTLDILVAINKSMRPPFVWLMGDCKFEEKPYRFSLFLDPDRFRDEVDEKFENVIKWFNNSNEQFCRTRMIIVTNEACAQCQRMLQNLRLGNEPHSIVKGNYVFVTVDSIIKQIRHRMK